MKNIMLVTLVALCIFACGDNSVSPSPTTGLSSNTVWPYEVTGEVDIIDAGIDDSDYAHWAIGSIVVNGENIAIEFELSVLKSAGIDLDFNFSNPAILMLEAPKSEQGILTYPVVKIK